MLFRRTQIVYQFMLNVLDWQYHLMLALFLVVVGNFKTLRHICLHRFVEEVILNLWPDEGSCFQSWWCNIQGWIFGAIDGRNVAANQKIIWSTLLPRYWLFFEIFIFRRW